MKSLYVTASYLESRTDVNLVCLVLLGCKPWERGSVTLRLSSALHGGTWFQLEPLRTAAVLWKQKGIFDLFDNKGKICCLEVWFSAAAWWHSQPALPSSGRREPCPSCPPFPETPLLPEPSKHLLPACEGHLHWAGVKGSLLTGRSGKSSISLFPKPPPPGCSELIKALANLGHLTKAQAWASSWNMGSSWSQGNPGQSSAVLASLIIFVEMNLSWGQWWTAQTWSVVSARNGFQWNLINALI